ncbi:MAG: amylo-alpha-1,6-glucosidase [Thermodesulfobacteriota bacterium]
MSPSSIVTDWLHQEPRPGDHHLMFRGDVRTFRLFIHRDIPGKAWIRTNIGRAGIIRGEIIEEIRHETPRLGRAWFDIPMRETEHGCFEITLPLGETGHFEAKCFFLPEGEKAPLWPEGGNTVINVEPADTCCGNIVYNTFVRQFGPNKNGRNPLPWDKDDIVRKFDESGYTVIPPSGTFRDLIRELDFIIHDLGCRFLQLLPIHPTPTTFARMGRFGSPYASLSFTAVDPALAEFDPKATPLEQFIELVDAVHARNAKIILDIAINHTGWAASLHETHPEWLVRDPEGRIEAPGAWGVIWADLTKLDYSKTDLWEYMAEVFLIWCHRGVDGFRCDAGYMIPVPAWTYIVATVRNQYPDTIFLLEGLGGKISDTRAILNEANFNWAYSELFQNYDRGQIEHYLPEVFEISLKDGIMVHFAETHDNNRLAARSPNYARMRTALCALCAPFGAYGYAGGVEWYATEKIDVHEANSLNWGASHNQIGHLRRLSDILKNHPCFHDQTDLKPMPVEGDNQIVLMRHHRPSGKTVFVVVNLDEHQEGIISWNLPEDIQMPSRPVDLVTGREIDVSVSGQRVSCRLAAGEVLCLSMAPGDLEICRTAGGNSRGLPERIKQQRIRAKALDIHTFYNGIGDLAGFDPDQAAGQLVADPLEFCRLQNRFSQETRVIHWQYPEDRMREVMIPPNHFLFVRAPLPFQARIINDRQIVTGVETSLEDRSGGHFCLFQPAVPPQSHTSHRLKIRLFASEKAIHCEAPLLLLSSHENCRIQTSFTRHDLLNRPLCFSVSNGRGACLRARLAWGRLESRYDALLAANFDSSGPNDRCILFSRCRAWLVYQGYSQEVCLAALDRFILEGYSRGVWQFRIPSGQGEYTLLSIALEMPNGKNTVRMMFHRHGTNGDADRLADHKEVLLILRPDIECRNFHETTKAYVGPETAWREAVHSREDHFVFSPAHDRHLSMRLSDGRFFEDVEWHYMVHRALDGERGLDPLSDLFSPGYFQVGMKGGDSAVLSAEALETPKEKKALAKKAVWKTSAFRGPSSLDPVEALTSAMDHFLVSRDGLKSVIAGYPWFLDWGRDSLIFTRGLIAAGKTDEARAVLLQFGRFEQSGTLPNMIRGRDAGNRETADAPLWFFIACEDLLRTEGDREFLDTGCGAKTLREALISIGRGYVSGTPNGVKMDPETGLIFCPAHYTWMDTNYPAGTPREGYPIEIQAMWYRALRFLATIDPTADRSLWKEKATQVRDAISRLYVLDHGNGLSDCRHCPAGVSATKAEPDDAIRPNQLLAVTLGALNDIDLIKNIVAACSRLLVPGAIRSLADAPLQRRPLEVRWQNRLLVDPLRPYQGRYSGDEDTARKAAYHNGTAWTWLFPSFCEAWIMAYGPPGKQTALDWLGSSIRVINTGTVGQVPEILDGDFPHRQKGCDAQAWGVSELLRVWKFALK